MRQLIEPNLNVQEAAGWCLRYVDRSFGVPAAYLTAWSAWQATKFKHQDSNFPNVAVPVWFDWWGDIGNGRQRYGHVAYRTSDGIVHSAPLRGFGSNTFASVDTLCQQFGNGMTYVGWSEDISNVKVVGGDDDMYTEANFSPIFEAISHRKPTPEDRIWIGRPILEHAQAALNHPSWLTDNHKIKFWDILQHTAENQQQMIDELNKQAPNFDAAKLEAIYQSIGKALGKK